MSREQIDAALTRLEAVYITGADRLDCVAIIRNALALNTPETTPIYMNEQWGNRTDMGAGPCACGKITFTAHKVFLQTENGIHSRSRCYKPDPSEPVPPAAPPPPPGEEEVTLTQAEFDALLEYSTTIPTGATIGKRWKRNDAVVKRLHNLKAEDDWWMGEYVPSTDPKMVGIRWRRILIVKPPLFSGLEWDKLSGDKQSEINFNDFVWVRLTDQGRAIYRAQWDAIRADHPRIPEHTPKPEVDGWSRWQLWELARTFGAHLYNGNTRLPFAMTIRLTDPAL